MLFTICLLPLCSFSSPTIFCLLTLYNRRIWNFFSFTKESALSKFLCNGHIITSAWNALCISQLRYFLTILSIAVQMFCLLWNILWFFSNRLEFPFPFASMVLAQINILNFDYFNTICRNVKICFSSSLCCGNSLYGFTIFLHSLDLLSKGRCKDVCLTDKFGS